jgi:hypothetical protein
MAVRAELCELFSALDSRSERFEEPLYPGNDSPVAVHAQYTGEEALLAFGEGSVGKPPTRREGVRWLEQANADLLFVTLRKSEKTFSPSTMYRDYALTRSLLTLPLGRLECAAGSARGSSSNSNQPLGHRVTNQPRRGAGSDLVLCVAQVDVNRRRGDTHEFTCRLSVKSARE